jgi:hypothetical protein
MADRLGLAHRQCRQPDETDQERESNPRTVVRSELGDQEADHVRRMDPLISASRGTLAGDLLWLGTFGFILAIITGMIG